MAYKRVTTLTEFILKEEKQFAHAQGSFTLLMVYLQEAVKIIASHVKESGLVDILGKSGSTNTYGEEVQKLDEFSNQLLVDLLLSSGEVAAVASEELPAFVQSDNNQGEYIVCFDPLDGSSNIDTNNSIGTIFSVYHKTESMFEKGSKQVAAGYVIYGPSVIFVYSAGNGVNGFTLDPSIGSFLLSHPDIKIPAKKEMYSLNEGNYEKYDEGTKKYLDSLKKEGYKARYVGSMVADIHRTLLKGGIFIYPSDAKSPEGKLRLLFEINPMAFLITHAGGKASSNGKDPLEIMPEKVDQRLPIALGSSEEVGKYEKFTAS